MAKRTTKKQSKKEYTLAEFKAWLEGIEELQPNNWAPDAGQWKTIRDKMMNIVEEEVVAEVPAPRPAPQPRVQLPVDPGAGWGPPPAPVGPAGAQGPDGPMQSNLEISPEAQAVLNGGKLPTEMAPGPDGKVHTPNIDTSDGNYQTSFE